MGKRMPVLFIAHGSPTLLDEAIWVNELKKWALTLPQPKAILMLSAHWELKPATCGATQTVPLVYDFYGFPEQYYHIVYPAPGALKLAERVHTLLTNAKIPVSDAPKRGLDHGAYVPLVCMYEKADIPTLQISMPSLDAKELHALGKTLAPLRDEGVLIIGSGFLVHNLRQGFQSTTPQWARDFDGWIADVLKRQDLEALLNFETKSPQLTLAHPTHEHLAPIFFCVGAAENDFGKSITPITGFWQGAFSRRSVQFG